MDYVREMRDSQVGVYVVLGVTPYNLVDRFQRFWEPNSPKSGFFLL